MGSPCRALLTESSLTDTVITVPVDGGALNPVGRERDMNPEGGWIRMHIQHAPPVNFWPLITQTHQPGARHPEPHPPVLGRWAGVMMPPQDDAPLANQAPSRLAMRRAHPQARSNGTDTGSPLFERSASRLEPRVGQPRLEQRLERAAQSTSGVVPRPALERAVSSSRAVLEQRLEALPQLQQAFLLASQAQQSDGGQADSDLRELVQSLQQAVSGLHDRMQALEHLHDRVETLGNLHARVQVLEESAKAAAAAAPTPAPAPPPVPASPRRTVMSSLGLPDLPFGEVRRQDSAPTAPPDESAHISSTRGFPDAGVHVATEEEEAEEEAAAEAWLAADAERELQNVEAARVGGVADAAGVPTGADARAASPGSVEQPPHVPPGHPPVQPGSRQPLVEGPPPGAAEPRATTEVVRIAAEDVMSYAPKRPASTVSYEITVPERAQPGTVLQATTPQGQKLKFRVPPHALPGAVITFSQPADDPRAAWSNVCIDNHHADQADPEDATPAGDPIFEAAKRATSAQRGGRGGRLTSMLVAPENTVKKLQRQFTSLSPAEIHRRAQFQQEFKPSESVWDAVLLLRTLPVGCAGGAFMWLLLVVCIFMQGALMFIIITQLTEETITDADVEDYAEWRRTAAHSVTYMNPLTQKAMAAEACDGSKALVFSTVQAQAHEDLVNYLGSSVEGASQLLMTPGSFTCLITLAVWSLTIAKELNLAVQAVAVMLALPVDRNRASVDEHGAWTILSLDRWSQCELIAVQLVRIAAALILGVAGNIYLARTLNVPELLLNVVALEFVIQLDELLFACCAPLRVKQLCANLEPLKIPMRRRMMCHGLDVYSAMGAVLTVVSVACFMQLMVYPQQQLLFDARDALCAGNLDFVYAPASGSGSVSWTATEAERTEGERPQERSAWWAAVASRPAATENATWGSRDWPADRARPPHSFAEAAITGILQDDVTSCLSPARGRCFQGRLLPPRAPASNASIGALADGTWQVPELDPCCVAQQLRVPSVGSTVGRWSVQALSSETLSQANNHINPYCWDLLTDPAPVARAGEIDALNDEGERILTDANGCTYLEDRMLPCTAPRGPCKPHPPTAVSDAADPLAACDSALCPDELILEDVNQGSDDVSLLRGAVGDTFDIAPCGGTCPMASPLCLLGQCVVPTCEILRPYCHQPDEAGVRIRQFCPVTCGCNDPGSSLVLSLPNSGCGYACQETESYHARLEDTPCEDVDVNGTQPQSAAFRAYLAHIITASQEWPSTTFTYTLSAAVDRLLADGCDALLSAGSLSVDFAELMCTLQGDDSHSVIPIKPIPIFCPVACGCSDPDSELWGCPSTCHSEAEGQRARQRRREL